MSVNPPEGTLTIENSHLDVKGNVSAVALKLGTLRLTPSYGLDAVANVSNSTTHTLELSNATTGLVTTANVVVGKDLTVSGNATVSSNLTVTGNATVAGNVSLTGTGSIVVPVGTTAQRPATGLSGMVRLNTTIGLLEYYNGSIWASLVYRNSNHPIATGGNTFDVSGYRVHAFTRSDNFTVHNITGTSLNVDILLIGGGGGGGFDNAGAGGAGGLIFKPNHTLTNGATYFASIGNGGQGSVRQAPQDSNDSYTNDNAFYQLLTKNGENTLFGDLTALGGGRGSSGDGTNQSTENGSVGGSGGGGQGESGTKAGFAGTQTTDSSISTDSRTYGHGNSGGNGSSSDGGGGGGGGAGTAGSNGTNSSLGGVGGNGLKEVTVDGTLYNFATIFGTTYGVDSDSDGNRWFAGGGGGANVNGNNNNVAGGKGGGGIGKGADGGYDRDDRGADPESHGDTNTGSGGAGATYNAACHGGSGGSGIIILRYQL